MKIYFTASTTAITEQKRYLRIIKDLLKHKHTFVSGLQIINPILLKKDTDKPATEIFIREKQNIDLSDCVIAEVTEPSIGVGGEIVYALVHHKPVLALFYKEADNLLSPMVAGNPSEHLFLEHYEDDNIGIVLKRFIDQVKLDQKRKGKLIVIDGGDGSGKATQSELLIKYLEKQKQKVKYLDFPRYYSSFHGNIVARFLAGEFGTLDAVSPYLASLSYALDRASAKDEMDSWLSHGKTLICNRYATSSMAHQGSKLPLDKRNDFVSWLDELEYKVHKIPREDVVVYLYVPWKIGYELTLNKETRKYIKGKLDIAESDINHRKSTEEMYLKLARERKNWIRIDCAPDGKILPKLEIHRMVIESLQKRKLIP
jgi:dTMP kinase